LKQKKIRRFLIPLLLVAVVACAVLFASPIAAFRSPAAISSPSYIIRNGYLPPGEIIIEKHDKNTDALVTTPGPPWFTVNIFPNPYDPTSPSPLSVVDNGPFDQHPAVGIIYLINVPIGTYSITETVAPPGYQVDPDAMPATVESGTTARVVSRDIPTILVPVSSGISLWLLIGVFAALIVTTILWKKRKTIFSGSSRSEE
jgi:hypothetical protein